MGHMRAPINHGIKLPVVTKSEAKSKKYYADCRAFYGA